MRRLALPAAALAAVMALTGCAGSSTNDGSMPTPAGGGGSSESTGGTAPTTTPSEPGSTPPTSTGPGKTAAPKAQVIVVPGKYAGVPAVQGLMAKYPIYYKARADRNDSVIKETFPAYFYLDVTDNIQTAKSRGWVMRPPGSVVVMSTVNRPHGVVRLNLCLSQRTQYWNPAAKKWAKAAPQGLPQVVEMIETGMGWSMYREMRPDQPFSCARVRFPA